MLHQENFFAKLHGGKNFRELDHRRSLTEAAIDMSLKNSCTLYDKQIISLNIVLLRSSQAQNIQAVHQKDFGKVRQSKQIKFPQLYDKW